MMALIQLALAALLLGSAFSQVAVARSTAIANGGSAFANAQSQAIGGGTAIANSKAIVSDKPTHHGHGHGHGHGKPYYKPKPHYPEPYHPKPYYPKPFYYPCKAEYCEECAGYPYKCKKCEDGYYLYDYKCYEIIDYCLVYKLPYYPGKCGKCEDGYYLYDHKCYKIIYGCAEYKLPYYPEKCVKCEAGYYYNWFKCYKYIDGCAVYHKIYLDKCYKCKDGYYLGKDYKCYEKSYGYGGHHCGYSSCGDKEKW